MCLPNTVDFDEIRKAFCADDTMAVRELLARQPALKARINDPVGPFDSPAILGVRSRAMLDVMLEAGADINARSRWWAGGFGLLDTVEPELAAYAIGRGAVVDVHAAARLGMMTRLRELIGRSPELVHARGGDGQTPLHFARDIAVAEFLIRHGAVIDARDIDHESTPAQYMIRDRQPVARWLVERGAKTDILLAAALGDLALVRRHLDLKPAAIRTEVSDRYFPRSNPHSGGSIYVWTLGNHKSAHQVAKDFGHEPVFELLMQRSSDEVRLATACEVGDKDMVRALLQQRPNIRQALVDDDRRRIVHAAENNKTQTVRLMMDAGWPIDVPGRHGATPLHWAGFHGNDEMAEALLAGRPPLEVMDGDFKATPLGWAIYGSRHGWHAVTGNYAATVTALLRAGSVIPSNYEGTEAVQAVLRQFNNRGG